MQKKFSAVEAHLLFVVFRKIYDVNTPTFMYATGHLLYLSYYSYIRIVSQEARLA